MDSATLNRHAKNWAGKTVRITWLVHQHKTIGIIRPNVGKAPSLWDNDGHRQIILIDAAEVSAITLADPPPLTSPK